MIEAHSKSIEISPQIPSPSEGKSTSNFCEGLHFSTMKTNHKLSTYKRCFCLQLNEKDAFIIPDDFSISRVSFIRIKEKRRRKTHQIHDFSISSQFWWSHLIDYQLLNDWHIHICLISQPTSRQFFFNVLFQYMYKKEMVWLEYLLHFIRASALKWPWIISSHWILSSFLI